VVMLGPPTTFSVKACDVEPPALSVTLAVKFDGPVMVGVPVIAPPVLIERPFGSDPPVIVHV